MKAPSLLVKITLANLLAVAAVMALVSTMVYRSLNEHFQAENRTSQERSLRWFQKHFEDLWPLTTEAVNRQCRELAKEGPERGDAFAFLEFVRAVEIKPPYSFL